MFRVTIRDVLWLTVVAAMGVAWWIDRSRLVVVSPTPPAAAKEKYEVIMGGKDGDKVFLFDPGTGEMWQRQSNGKWKEYAKSPDSSAKQTIPPKSTAATGKSKSKSN